MPSPAAYLPLLLQELACAYPSWKANRETLRVYANELGELEPEILEQACAEHRRAHDFPPSIAKLRQIAARLVVERENALRHRREYVRGVRRERIAHALEIVSDPERMVPSFTRPGERVQQWSPAAVSAAERVLAEVGLSADEARATLDAPDPIRLSTDEQAGRVLQRVRERLGLDQKSTSNGTAASRGGGA